MRRRRRVACETARRGSFRAARAIAAGLLALGLGAEAADEETKSTAPPRAVPAFRQADHVAVLTVQGEIDRLTLRSLERRIAQARSQGATAIVLDIDTPGGRLDATLDICNLLKDTGATPPNTVAWIHPQAYSAGTIIALACREIVVAPNATFGDAAPIQGMPVVGLQQLQPAERAKVEAPILAEVVDSARRNHYDENLVQSFVSYGIELWLIEHVDTGKRVIVDRNEYRAVFGEDPPSEITPVSSPGRRVAPKINTSIPRAAPATSSGMTAEEIRRQIEFQQQLPPTRAPLTEADRGSWRPVMQVISDDRLLTVKTDEALYYGLAVETIGNDQQLIAFFGALSLVRYDRTWSESLVRILVSWPVRVVLIVIFLVSLFVEMAAPGLGVFGATALVALSVLIGAPYLAGMAQWWDVLLIAAGLVLIALEILVIPGLGVAGFVGAACLLIGMIGTFVSGDLASPKGQSELGTGIASILGAVFLSGVGIWLLSRNLGTLPVVNRLMLSTEIGSRRSRSEGAGLLEAMGAKPQGALGVGDLGLAETDLRPAGRGSFGGRLVDVQSPGRYIERGRSIRVTAVDRYVIEVEEVDR